MDLFTKCKLFDLVFNFGRLILECLDLEDWEEPSTSALSESLSKLFNSALDKSVVDFLISFFNCKLSDMVVEIPILEILEVEDWEELSAPLSFEKLNSKSFIDALDNSVLDLLDLFSKCELFDPIFGRSILETVDVEEVELSPTLSFEKPNSNWFPNVLDNLSVDFFDLLSKPKLLDLVLDLPSFKLVDLEDKEVSKEQLVDSNMDIGSFLDISSCQETID